MVNVAVRDFHIWKLEFWWIAFNKPEFYPENRRHLFKNVFWRTSEKEIKTIISI